MKKISIMVPCYNEQDNVIPMAKALVEMFHRDLPNYDYEILFIDNASTDDTRAHIRAICAKNKKIRAIFNIRNFGQFNSPFYGIIHTTGDCTIPVVADFQDPLELIPQMVKKWEEGYKIVCAVKTHSGENPIMYRLRGMYYHMIRKMSSTEQIEQFTGFGLYDRSFVKILQDLKDPTPFLRGIVGELGFKRCEIEYTQPKRRTGKTHNNFFSLYDAAMLSFTTYTSSGLRVATFLGCICTLASLTIGIVYLILKLIFWDRFAAGIIPAILLIAFIGSLQLTFTGLLGEYVISMNRRLLNRPLVIEEERLNFDDDEDIPDTIETAVLHCEQEEKREQAGDSKEESGERPEMTETKADEER
jgi:glycosyltransferase involved in cell wall biosynthesis